MFGLLWIWLSDSILTLAGVTGVLSFWAEALKGTAFVLLSTAIVFLIARREARVQGSSARLLEAVVNGTTDAVFVKDTSGKYLLFNEGAARLVGRPTAEVLGKDDTFLFDPDSASRVMARDRRVLANGQTETEEEELTADGVTRTYLATKAAYRDERGMVVGLIGISRDITDRKRAEVALRESEERFRALVELAPDSIVLLVEGRVVFANAAAARMVCAPAPEAIVGISLTENMHPDDQPASLVRQAAIVERNEVYPPHEVRIRRLDGEYIDVETCAGPCVVGGERGIQVIARDVSERKREDSLLTRQNAILERITAGESLPRVLDEIVRLVESLDPGTLGSILLLDREGRLRLGSAPSLPPEYNAAIDGVVIGPCVGSCGTAAFTRAAVFVEDIATDPLWADFATLALGHGLQACWSVPIFATSHGDDPPAVLGTFAVYTRAPRAPTPRLIELLHRAVHLASIAIERDRADRELRESEERLADAQRLARMGSWRWEPTTGRVWWSDALHSLYGIDAAEVSPSFESFLVCLHPDDRPLAAQRVEDMLAGGESFADDLRIVRPGGEVRWIHSQAWATRNAAGQVLHVEGTDQDITERKRAEAALRESEGRFRTLVENATDGIFLHDESGMVIDANDWACHALGYTRDELIGMSPVQFDDTCTPEGSKDLAVRLRDGEMITFEGVHRRKDGTAFPVEVRVRQFIAGGRRQGLSFVRDISSRKRAEQELRESEERLQLALAAGRLGVWEWDVKTDAVFWSAEAYPIVGVQASQFGGSLDDFQRLVHPDDRDALWAKVADSLAAGGPAFDHEYRCIRPGGSVRWLMNQGKVSRDTDGRATRMTGVVADITDRKLAESTQARLAAIVESSDDAILSKSLDGVIQSWNGGAERLFGYTEAEAVGRPVTILFPQDRMSEEGVILGRILHGERVEHFDTVRVTKDGRRVNVSLTISPIRNADGRVVAASKIVHDITDRVRTRQYLAIQHAVASTLAESDHVQEASPAILRTVCQTLGWTAGDLWLVDRERGCLVPAGAWSAGESATDFLASTFGRTFAPGEGLPGRVWESESWVWIPHIDSDASFLRRAEAARAGLQAAFTFPIRSGGMVVGVIEFFHSRVAAPDHELLGVFEVLGNQIGQFAERNRSRAALRESEGRLRLFVEHAPAALAMFDRDLRYMVASRRWVSDYRLSEGGLVGRSHYEIFPEISAEWRAVHTRALTGEVLRAERDSFVRKDGTTQWLRWEVRPWYDTAGAVGGIVMFADDITASVLGEAALRENEERFRRLVDSIMDGVISIDADQRVILFNPAAEKMFGLQATEVLGGPLDRLLPARHRANHVAHVEEFRRTGVTNRSMGALGAVSAVRGDGEEFPIEASISQIEVSGRRISTAIVRDISARVRAEADLRESEEQFRATFEQAAVGIAHVATDGRFLRVNERYAGIAGHTPSELVGRTFQMITHPDDLAADLDLVGQLLAGDIPHYAMEKRYIRKAGGEVWVNLTVSLRRDQTGRPLYFIAVVEDISARKDAEAAMRESETRFRNLVEFLPDAIFLNVDGRVNFCNPACVGLFGASRADELIGKTPFDLHPPEWHDLIRGRIAAQHETGERAAGVEEEVLRLDGGRVPVFVTALPIIDRGSKALLVALHDLTERKRAEAVLRESEARFRTLVECLPDAVFLHVAGLLVFCNPACIRLLGATGPNQIVGKSLFELLPREDHEAVRQRVAHMESTGQPVPSREQQFIRLDGAVIWASVTASPIHDAGRPAFLVVLRDLTEQRRMEAQLRHQELMIREAGELAHVGGWGFDPATGQGDWTPETARIHGLPPSQATTVANGLSFYAGEDQKRIEGAVAAAAAHGTPYDLELQLTAAGGESKWVRTICRPIVDNGKVVRVRGSIQDITDRKRAEEEIRELNAGLERRVRERTAELQEVNRELESFSYSVSHDLRAPIRHITAFTSLVLDSGGAALPAESREQLEQVTKAAGRMGQLVDDLLRFSRLGRQPVRRQPVDTQRLVEDCLREVINPANPRRFDTRVGDLPNCEGDLALLRQVWVNLLANAVKYTGPRDPAVIEVGAEVTPDGLAYFVRDNGVGFDMKYAHKLFGVFQRLHRAEEFEGTGIGLALVQRIIHRHGGRVWARSELGHGSTFYFTLGDPAWSEPTGHSPP